MADVGLGIYVINRCCNVKSFLAQFLSSFKVYRIKKPRPKARGEGLSRYHPNSPKKASARCGKSSLKISDT